MGAVSRRAFLVTGAGLLLGGCGGSSRNRVIMRPAPSERRLTGYGPRELDTPSDSPTIHVRPKPGAPRMLLRSAWADRDPIPSRMDAMNGVRAITVHHEGMPTPVYCTSDTDVIAELQKVRAAHVGREWGDIGYHYIVDRTGRIWEGRPMIYQGAHVKDNNEHNIGVMVLGNFEIQFPTAPQKATLEDLLRYLMTEYRVPVSSVYTHRELGRTACPGRYLQPHVDSFRRSV